MLARIAGWLLGLEETTSIRSVAPSLAAPWAQDGPFWVFLGSATLLLLSVVFYLKFQTRGRRATRLALGVCRGLLLVMLLLTLASPVLSIGSVSVRRPLLFVVFDGTDSMAIADRLTDRRRQELSRATQHPGDSPLENVTRMDWVRALLRAKDENLLATLQERSNCRIEAYLFDGNSTSRLRTLDSGERGGRRVDPARLADQLTTDGQVTALGAVLTDIDRQFGAERLAGVVMFSDFANNSGSAPVGGADGSPVARLGVPVYAVGVGTTSAMDLTVDLRTDPKMKRAERTNIAVDLRQTGLDGRDVTVEIFARRQSGRETAVAGREPIGRENVTLNGPVVSLDVPFVPEESGPFDFVVEVAPLDGEVVVENNRASRQVNVIDDYLRLMYAAHEPTWEWRFIKEVFHRDALVGMDGFRTYLASSHPRVRESNPLFLATLRPSRGEFFKNDVIFVGDMPGRDLSAGFGELMREFVGTLGGGMVVISGPRFGPAELEGTPLADMLPVIPDPAAGLVDDVEFRLRRTAHAGRYPFMRLGDDQVEDDRAWDNLGPLPWYQPVAAVHEQAYVLAEHPNDVCADGVTGQPLIAIRPYGNGEVVYLAFNETWRFRRRYGERYYRRFWSQLIYRLGMSHALGDDKRFVARLDRRRYRVEDQATLTVEAYDEDYEPLGGGEGEGDDDGVRGLTAELTVPARDASSSAPRPRPLLVPMLRPGVFETRIPLHDAGQYVVRVKDPIKEEYQELVFDVSALSAERRSAVRDERLQLELARRTGGRAYDLTDVGRLVEDLRAESSEVTTIRDYALWHTPFWFTLVVLLMLGEWLIRKLVRLT